MSLSSSNILRLVSAATLCGTVSLGCGPTDERADTVDEYIRSLQPLLVEDESRSVGTSNDAQREGDFSCTTTNFSQTRQYDKIVAYSANSGSLWPGAILRGDSVYDGLFTPTPLPRAPMTFSLSLENLEGSHARLIADPKLSTYRDALSDILSNEITGATPANIYAEIDKVHSEKQLSLALGAQASWATGSVATSFDFAKQETKSRYLVKYTQAYYTVDVDPPGQPSDFLAESVTVADVADHMGRNNPPVYVSSITYGRMVVFTFESDYSSQELGAALEFAYRGGVEASGNVSVTYKEMLSNSNITAYILGGSGEHAARSINDFDDLMDFIKTGGNYSKDSPGAPIAYKLAYLADNTPARMSFTEEYEVKDCVRVSQKIRVTLEAIYLDQTEDNNSDLEIYGEIFAQGNNLKSLFNRDENEYLIINQGETWPATGIIAETVIDVTPQAGQSIYLGANLMDNDRFLGIDNDHLLGDEALEIAFETGWRKDVTVHLTGDKSRVDLLFRIQPI